MHNFYMQLINLTSAVNSCAVVQQATNEAVIKQLNLELETHKAHIDMLNSRLEQVTADVHQQCNALNPFHVKD